MTCRFSKGRIRWVRPLLYLVMVSASWAGSARSDLPKDVRQVLDRRQGCDHWLGEEPYDAERRRQIERVVRGLGCAHLEKDEARLRRRYAASPAIIAALAHD